MTITRGLLTIDEAIDYVGRNATTGTAELEDAVTAVSRKIERYCGRHFDQVTEARTFVVSDLCGLTFGPYNDLTTLTTLKTDAAGDGTYETTISASSYQLEPLNAALRSEPYLSVRLLGGTQFPSPVADAREDLIQVTGVWGWPAIPAEVKQAARFMLNEFVKLQDAPLGVAGGGDMGSVYVGRNRRIPDLLQPYVHPLHMGLA